jgi:dihydroflavonol-4-reductase
MNTVLVTGGTGFVAGWTIRYLLERGNAVIATARSLDKAEVVKKMLEEENVPTERLTFVEIDLQDTTHWDGIMSKVDFVLHVASPLGVNGDQNDPSLVETAVAGVENVLNAAIRGHVKKVVMTSSEAANFPNANIKGQIIDESCWTSEDLNSMNQYMLSKLKAEKRAWEIMGEHPEIGFSTIMPAAIFGPFMGGRKSSIDKLIDTFLQGTPNPKVTMSIVDVRDLAMLHILAMESKEADGERFIGESGDILMPEIAKILKNSLGEAGKNIKTSTIPDFIVKLGARNNSVLFSLLPMLNIKYHRTNAKAKKVLNWNPRSIADTMIDSANYVLEGKVS